MKSSIRTKFGVGMVFIFVIILVLLGFSAFYLNKLSNKTSAILEENYLSVVYAREMSEGLMNINQEITTSFLTNRNPDSTFIRKELVLVDHSLQLEKSNITESGEDKLVAGIETGIIEFRDSILKLMESNKQVDPVLQLQKKFGSLHQQLLVLSQMNGKAIEVKTNDAKVSSKNALAGMTILGSFCFLIALSFIYSFASYFNERFFQLYNGIKEIVSSNYGQRLYFDGTDEFYEISLLFNEMAGKLDENRQKLSVPLLSDTVNEEDDEDIEELKSILIRIKSIEAQAEEVISKLENKK
jgi:methyl-accepting chemotaxis protein